MAQTLEELVLRLSMDSKRLQRELRTVQTKNKHATTRMRQAWNRTSAATDKYIAKLSLVRGTLALVAAATAAAFSTKRALDYADALDKTARKLGISTGALQEWRFAAGQSGVAIATLEMSLQRYIRRAGEAADGTGEARNAIKELNITLRDSEGRIRRSEDLFSDAMDALNRIDEPAKKLALAQKLFDSEGVAVVNLSADFQRLTQQAREMGIVLDADLIQQAVRSKDQLTALSLSVQARLIPAFIGLAPQLVRSAQLFAQVADFASTLWARFVDIEKLTLHQTIERITQSTLELRKEQEEFDRVNATMIARFGRDDPQVQRSIEGRSRRLREMNEELAATWKRLRALQELNQTDANLLPLPKDIEASSEALDSWRKAFRRVENEVVDSSATIKDSWDGMQGDLSDGFARLAIDGETSFKQIGQSFLREVVATIIRSQVLGTLMSFFGGASNIGASSTYSGPFAAQFNPPGVGSGVSLPGSGVYLPGPIPRHAGGPVSAGRSYLVGERGPELIKPRSPGMVVPNSALGGGGGISVVVHNYSNEPVETQDNDGPSKKELEIFIGQAASKSVLRGGDLSQAISSRFGSKPVGRSGA